MRANAFAACLGRRRSAAERSAPSRCARACAWRSWTHRSPCPSRRRALPPLASETNVAASARITEGIVAEPTAARDLIQSYVMTDDAIGCSTSTPRDYEALRRRLVPAFDALYGTAVAALGLARRRRGACSISAPAPDCSRARSRAPIRRPSSSCSTARRRCSSRRAAHWGARVLCARRSRRAAAGRPWDAIVSALAIHHLEDDAKRELFARIHAALAPGGVFVNAEQVSAPTPFFDAAYRAWHERRALELGASPAEWAGRPCAHERRPARRRRASARVAARGRLRRQRLPV